MALKQGISLLKEDIAEQLEFIEWLIERGMYNPMESGITTNKMFKVWKTMKEEHDGISFST